MRLDRIVLDPAVMRGKPCIKGTRIPVEQIVRELAGGMTIDAVLDAHPRLNLEDIYAALEYSADVLRQVWLTTQPALLSEYADPISGG